jgi:hypothetical protein
MSKSKIRLLNIPVSIERIPWYWISIFTSLAFMFISIFVNHVTPYRSIFEYGGEYGAVGLALAQGRGFSDPFATGSGATAWVSPLLPVILGSVFFITNFKIISAFWILHSIKIISIGLGIGLIWDVLRKSRSGFAAVYYFWICILFYFYYDEFLNAFHDQWFIFFIISLNFWAWHKRDSLSGQIVLFIALSMAALCNPILWGSLFSIMLVFNQPYFNKLNKETSNRPKTFLAQNSFRTAILISCVLIIGWTARNWTQLHMLAPIKSNAGYEIFQSQFTSKNGLLNTSTVIEHPHNPLSKEHQIYSKLGESTFVNIRRDMAVKSIMDNPSFFFRRITQRFSNAFLFTYSSYDVYDVDPQIRTDDLERLRNAGLVGYIFYRKVWINLNGFNKEVASVLPTLNLANQSLVERDWLRVSAVYSQYLFSFKRIAGGCLIGGLPWIAFLLAILMRRRSVLPSYVFWAGLFTLIYLIPYVLISHYLRYQIPLLGMQAILLTAGTMAILRIPKVFRK